MDKNALQETKTNVSLSNALQTDKQCEAHGGGWEMGCTTSP